MPSMDTKIGGGLSHVEALVLRESLPMGAMTPGFIELPAVEQQQATVLAVTSKEFTPWLVLWAAVAEDFANRHEGIEQLRSSIREEFVGNLSSESERLFAYYPSRRRAVGPFSFADVSPLEEAFWRSLRYAEVDYGRVKTRIREVASDAEAGGPRGEGALSISTRLGRRYERRLEDAGLLHDPDLIFFGGIGMVVLGLVPTEFNIRTREGERILTEINAGLWSYSRQRNLETNEEELRFQIELIRLVQDFAAAFRQAWGEARRKR